MTPTPRLPPAMLAVFAAVVALFSLLLAAGPAPAAGAVTSSSAIHVGVGLADATGLIGEINMLGYADLSQSASGIHLRLKARAFIYCSADDPTQRVVFVSLDTGFMAQRAKDLAISYLPGLIGSSDASYYTTANVMISATHTHSGVGGWEDGFMYQVTSLGTVSGQREKIAKGIAQAIANAHNDLIANGANTAIQFGSALLANASINRSAPSYLNNPASERAKYTTNVDEDIVVLSVTNPSTGVLRGASSWFAVHGTSMNNSNLLISGDNKGAASYLWELEQKAAGNANFTAIFGQSNAADVSPNIEGAHCTDTGDACDGSENSCGGDILLCIARGPGYDLGLNDFYSTYVIGRRQYLKAKDVATNYATQSTAGPVLYQHAFVDMTNVTVTLANGSTVKTCTPAMGYSFSAGTTDGVATQITWQGNNNTGSPLLDVVRDLIALTVPSAELVACQAPKPILLDTGDSKIPYLWQPYVLPLQMFVIGRKFAIIGQPSEISTMAGRRLRNSTLAALVSAGVVDSDARIVIAGLSNTYSSYCTTPEEYQVQRYEGASTIYGPYTLSAYQKLFATMAAGFANSASGLPAGTAGAEPSSDLSLVTPVVLDTVASGASFGGQLSAPVAVTPSVIPPAFTMRRRRRGGSASTTTAVATTASAVIGRDYVQAVFYCAHPRNGAATIALTGLESFMAVEKYDSTSGTWSTFLTDEGWDTKFSWERIGVAESHCTVEWDVGYTVDTEPGTYRFHIYGVAKSLLSSSSYDGVSDSFYVVSA
ncbi:hypothetical protein HK405_008888, partial [Cladochytrium tenue]